MFKAIPEYLAHYAKLFEPRNSVLHNYPCFCQAFVIAFLFGRKLLRFDASLSSSGAFSFEWDLSVELGKITQDTLVAQINFDAHLFWQTRRVLLEEGIVVPAAPCVRGLMDD